MKRMIALAFATTLAWSTAKAQQSFTLLVTDSSATVTISNPNSVNAGLLVYNEGPAELYWILGTPATVGNTPLPPGITICVNQQNAMVFSAIADSGQTTTLRVTQVGSCPLLQPT
jgi:hypothetical protein